MAEFGKFNWNYPLQPFSTSQRKSFYPMDNKLIKIWTEIVYLFFGNFKGFQVVTDDTEFFFKFDDFAV